jgi:hypothetical protein
MGESLWGGDLNGGFYMDGGWGSRARRLSIFHRQFPVFSHQQMEFFPLCVTPVIGYLPYECSWLVGPYPNER